MLLERLELDHDYARAAAIAVFNLKLRRAIQILGKGALVKPGKRLDGAFKRIYKIPKKKKIILRSNMSSNCIS